MKPGLLATHGAGFSTIFGGVILISSTWFAAGRGRNIMGAVTPSDLARCRERLLALKTKLVSEGDVGIEPVRTGVADVGSDEDAQPLTEMSQVIASKRNRDRTEMLARIVAALRRLDEAPHEFGACASCGEPIGRRLEQMPFVELCVECQAENDRPTRGARRRHVTDYR